MFEYRDFEELLQEKHAEQYHGLDDEMADAYIEWISELEVDDWIRYGHQYGVSIKKSLKHCAECGYEIKECDRDASGICPDCEEN